MKVEILADAEAAAARAASVIAEDARAAVAARGRFIMAVSGGHTPWVMLRALAGKDVPWKGVHVVQEVRLAPIVEQRQAMPADGESGDAL